MIRDLAQLGDRDIQVLGILATVHASAISHMPRLQDPHQFSKETPALRTAVANSGIDRDDFLSACERLRGFGLGAEVLRNTSHMGPEDFCYRPTRRGLLLLDYLKNLARVTPAARMKSDRVLRYMSVRCSSFETASCPIFRRLANSACVRCWASRNSDSGNSLSMA